jgi:hypothetical protein
MEKREFSLRGYNADARMKMAARLLHAGLWLGLLFNPEDGGDMFL